MNNYLFIKHFLKVAYTLHFLSQSRNKKNRPNKNNDVITDLGGGGNFPMFLYASRIYSRSPWDLRAGLHITTHNSHARPFVQRPVSL